MKMRSIMIGALGVLVTVLVVSDGAQAQAKCGWTGSAARLGGAKAIPNDLLNALKNCDATIQFKAATIILNKFDPLHKEAFAILLQGLKSEDTAKLSATVWTLYRIAAKNPETIAVLTKLLGHNNLEVRRIAASAFRDLGPLGKGGIPALIRALEKEDYSMAMTCAEALGNMGGHAQAAIPALRASSKRWGYLPSDAAAALVQIDPNNREGMDTLLRDLRWWFNPETRRGAALALTRIDPLPETALPAVTSALRDSCPNVRSLVAQMMPQFRSKTEAVIPHLRAALNDRMSGVRRSSAEALGKVGDKAVLAVPDLIAALRDPRPEVREEVALALGSIGPAAREAVAALRAALQDESARVREAAVTALSKIRGGKKRGAEKGSKRCQDPFSQLTSHPRTGIGRLGIAEARSVHS